MLISTTREIWCVSSSLLFALSHADTSDTTHGSARAARRYLVAQALRLPDYSLAVYLPRTRAGAGHRASGAEEGNEVCFS